MALSVVQITLPSTRRSGRNFFQIDRQRPVTIFNITKLVGDTTGNLDTKLESCKEIVIKDETGAVISGAAGTTGYGGTSTFTTALTGLGAGTFITVICKGNRATK